MLLANVCARGVSSSSALRTDGGTGLLLLGDQVGDVLRGLLGHLAELVLLLLQRGWTSRSVSRRQFRDWTEGDDEPRKESLSPLSPWPAKATSSPIILCSGV